MAAYYKDAQGGTWLSRVLGWLDASGFAQPVTAATPLPVGTQPGIGTATATRSSVNSAATNTSIVALNAARRGLIVTNTDANALKMVYGATATTSDYDVSLLTGETWEMPQPVWTGAVFGIWDADGTGAAKVVEFT